MARRSPLAGIPLASRLPNLPHPLVGRETDARALFDRLKAGPVAALHGPTGIGKTALALSVTHRARKRRPETVRWLRFGESASPRTAMMLLRALTPPGQTDTDDWSRLVNDPDAAWTATLDLAEEMGAWMVLDAEVGTAPLDALARMRPYARRSRWLAITRGGDAPDGGSIRLAALDPDAMSLLADRWAPELDPMHRALAIHAAGGSPGWLKRALALDPAQLRDPHLRGRLMATGTLPQSDPEALAFLAAVAAVDVALPAESAPACEHVDVLVRQGLIEARPGGWAMHPAVRRLVVAADIPHRAEVERRLAARLAASEAPGSAIDAVRLWLDHGEAERAAELLDRLGPRILAAGGAGDLWSVLRARTADATAAWRLRAAVDSGDTRGLAALGPPERRRPEVVFQWARVLTARGELDVALAAADAASAAARAADQMEVVRSAELVAARALMNSGRLEAGRERLEAIDQPSLDVTAHLLSCRGAMGDRAAIDEARALLARLDLIGGGPDVRSTALRLSLVLYRAGHLRDTLRVFDTLAAQRPLALRSAGIQTVTMAIQLGAGRLADARRTGAALRSDGRSLYSPVVELCVLVCRLAEGDLVGLAASIGQLTARAEAEGRPELHHFGAALADELARFRGVPPPPPSEGTVPVGTALQARRAIRWGMPPPEVPESLHVEARVLAFLHRADRALVDGRADDAATLATRARALTTSEGLAVRGLQTLEALCDALLVADRRTAARAVATELAEAAHAIGAGRASGEARWHLAMAAERVDLAVVEQLAGLFDRAPTAARRARAILGDETVSLDLIDRALLDALRRRPGWVDVEGPTEAWQPGWGLDRRQRRVWLPDGRWIEFDGKETQWALLSALADRVEDKEALVARVWHEKAYHPLRHDNRLHATVRLLRKALDDDGRIRTTESGYRLGGPVRCLRANA